MVIPAAAPSSASTLRSETRPRCGSWHTAPGPAAGWMRCNRTCASTRTSTATTGPAFDTLAAPICCPAIGAPAPQPYGFTRGPLAAKDHLFFSNLHYKLRQTAVFGEATVGVTPKLDLTAGAR